jgi:protein-S-isoprenylcysteine O-methyltransferase Ste14
MTTQPLETKSTSNQSDDPEPRWPAIVAILAVAGMYAALPASLAVIPRWVQTGIVCALLVPTVASHWRGNHRLNQILGHVVSAVMTLFLILSVALLVMALPAHTEAPATLLRSAIVLWVTNILVFAMWYWRLDGGGPNHRDLRGRHTSGAFLFPQMAMAESDDSDKEAERWSPHFIDYLFLAFNTSTAFSPTDAPVLSRWAKVLTMMQALLSLAIIALLAARAVNIL